MLKLVVNNTDKEPKVLPSSKSSVNDQDRMRKERLEQNKDLLRRWRMKDV